jgi:micrococcal nuclease
MAVKVVLGSLGGIMVLGIIGAVASPPSEQPQPVAAPAPALTVVRAVDGDTVELSDGSTVRLLGVDAPEVGECGHREATQFATSELVAKPGLVVAPDPTQADLDKDGRALRYLAVDGRDYSTAIADTGWAAHVLFGTTPVQKAPQITTAETAAKDAKRGIWGLACVAATPTPTPAPTTTTRAPDGDPKPQPKPQPEPEPQPKPQPQPEPERDEDDDSGSGGGGSVSYSRCADVPSAKKPLLAGEPGYSSKLDRDGDGRACEPTG